jgi:FAD/FMN-containing dehydrogenase
MGKHGATCDNVISLDVVTADGEMLTASQEQNSDLFWAMRGAGANFGIVTSFRYRLHPLDEVLAGMLLYPSPLSMALVFEVKGQIRRVPKDAMAFDHRDPCFEMSIIANWTEPSQDAANIEWARNVWSAAQPYVMPAVYTNHMTAEESTDRVRASYGADKYNRLAALKNKYDPDNFFCSNHNIVPQR